jgi:hypothetical protein
MQYERLCFWQGLTLFLVIVLIPQFFTATDGLSDSSQVPSRQISGGTNLYKVMISNLSEAQALSDINIDAVLRIKGGYLVLTGTDGYERMIAAGLECDPTAISVNRSQLALDLSHDSSNVNRYPIVYEEPGLRLLRVDSHVLYAMPGGYGLAPIRTRNLQIEYFDPNTSKGDFRKADFDVNIDSLLNVVSEDSLSAYIERLQIYRGLEAGRPPNHIAGNWAKDKFIEFGYDSVVVDTFYENIDGHIRQCRNIVCYKIGAVYPYHQIIVGGHRDTADDCPGADDNLSGTSGVLEIARALAGVETNMTVIFILFDAEEVGILGSWHYANEAVMRGDRIVFMLNMDMIGHYENDTQARCTNGDNPDYAQIWVSLADSIPSIGIDAQSGGSSGGSDYIPFHQNGYDHVYVSEYIHSSVYHTPSDSTAYLNYDYMRRVIMAGLATVYTVDAGYTPAPELIISYSGPISPLVTPDEPFAVDISIEEYAGGLLEPGTVQLHYSIGGDEFVALPMDELGGNLFHATVPSMECGSRIVYYVGAEDIAGSMYYYPDPESPNQAIMATSVLVAFEDDFEVARGWDVLGDASDGDWERWRAGDGYDIWTVPQYDFDGSGQCYLTNHIDWHDVDGGPTILISPEIDVSGGEAMVEYARWFKNDLGFPPHTDIMQVYIYDRGTIILLETIGPVEQASGEWNTNKFWISDYFNPTYPIKLRFDVSDLGLDSEVEAAVDAFKVTLFAFTPLIITEALPDGKLEETYSQQLEALGCAEPLIWTDKNGDLAGTGLTLSPDGHLTGDAIEPGSISFTASVQDTAGMVNEKAYTFIVYQTYLCGDANSDGQLNIGDAVFLINFVFSGGPAPDPIGAGDANCDGEPNVGDAVYLINYVFNDGPEPCCP